MKKTILSLMTVIAVFVFSGCSGSAQPKVQGKYGETYRVVSIEDGAYEMSIRNIEKVDLANPNSYTKQLKLSLNRAATISKEKGYSYFILVNTGGLNNLNGSPINNYKDLKRFITLKARKPSFATNGRNFGRGKHRIISKTGGNIYLAFKPVGNEFKNSFVSVWSVEQTLRDTK